MADNKLEIEVVEKRNPSPSPAPVVTARDDVAGLSKAEREIRALMLAAGATERYVHQQASGPKGQAPDKAKQDVFDILNGKPRPAPSKPPEPAPNNAPQPINAAPQPAKTMPLEKVETMNLYPDFVYIDTPQVIIRAPGLVKIEGGPNGNAPGAVTSPVEEEKQRSGNSFWKTIKDAIGPMSTFGRVVGTATGLLNVWSTALGKSIERDVSYTRGDILGGRIAETQRQYGIASGVLSQIPVIGSTLGGLVDAMGRLATKDMERFKALDQSFRGMGQQLAQYNPAIAFAQAQNEMASIMRQIRMGREMAPELTELMKKQRQLDDLNARIQVIESKKGIAEQMGKTRNRFDLEQLSKEDYATLMKYHPGLNSFTGDPVKDAESMSREELIAAFKRAGIKLPKSDEEKRQDLETLENLFGPDSLIGRWARMAIKELEKKDGTPLEDFLKTGIRAPSAGQVLPESPLASGGNISMPLFG